MKLSDVLHYMPVRVSMPPKFDDENGRWIRFVQSPHISANPALKHKLAVASPFKDLVDRMLKKTFHYWNSGNITGHAFDVPGYEQLGASKEELAGGDIQHMQYLQPGISLARGLRFITICAHKVQRMPYFPSTPVLVVDPQFTAGMVYLYSDEKIGRLIGQDKAKVLYKSESKAVTRPIEYEGKIFEAFFDTRVVDHEEVFPDIIVIGDPLRIKGRPYRFMSSVARRKLMSHFPKSRFVEITGKRRSSSDPTDAAVINVPTSVTPAVPGTIHTEEHNRGFSMFTVLSAVLQANNTPFEMETLELSL